MKRHLSSVRCRSASAGTARARSARSSRRTCSEKRGGRPGLAGSLPDLAALDRLWDARFAELGPWRELPPEAVHPSSHPTRLQRLANHVNELRDRHAAAVILDLLARGERVFAIAGGSHVVKQEPVLAAGIAAFGRPAVLGRPLDASAGRD